MERIDFSNLLTGRSHRIPDIYWSKFNNSWLHLKTSGDEAHYLVAYQACAFFFPPVADGEPRLVSKGYPGEIGSVWGYRMPEIWGTGGDSDSSDMDGEENWGGDEQGDWDDSSSDWGSDGVPMDTDGDDEDDMDYRHIRFRRTIGIARVSVRHNLRGRGSFDVRVTADRLFGDLLDHHRPQLLQDNSSGQIYLKTEVNIDEETFNAQERENPFVQEMEPDFYSRLTQIQPSEDAHVCHLGEQIFIGPETIPAVLQYNWYKESALYFNDNRLNVQPFGENKILKTGRYLRPTERTPSFCRLISTSVTTNIEVLERRLGPLQINPADCVKMQGPLIEVPRNDNPPPTERHVKRYLGVGQLILPFYEPFQWIWNIVKRQAGATGINDHGESTEQISATIDEAISECRSNMRVFLKNLKEHVFQIHRYGEFGRYSHALNRFRLLNLLEDQNAVDREISSDFSRQELEVIRSNLLGEFPEFLLRLYMCQPQDYTVRLTNTDTPYNVVSDYLIKDTPQLTDTDLVMPPDKISMIFLYDMLVGTGNENPTRPNGAWCQYRFSDAFLFKEGADLDPHAIAYNLAPTQGGYLMGYGASDRYAKVVKFTDAEVENLLRRVGSPADRMQFKFI